MALIFQSITLLFFFCIWTVQASPHGQYQGGVGWKRGDYGYQEPAVSIARSSNWGANAKSNQGWYASRNLQLAGDSAERGRSNGQQSLNGRSNWGISSRISKPSLSQSGWNNNYAQKSQPTWGSGFGKDGNTNADWNGENRGYSNVRSSSWSKASGNGWGSSSW